MKFTSLITSLFDKKIAILITKITLLVILVSVIIIIIIFSTQNNRSLESQQIREQVDREVLSRISDFGIEDFYLDSRIPEAEITYPLIKRKKHWTREDADLFKINPFEAGITTLKEDNDDLVKEILNSGN